MPVKIAQLADKTVIGITGTRVRVLETDTVAEIDIVFSSSLR